MRALTARESRLVAVGLLVLALALGWLVVIRPLVGGFFDRAAEREQLLNTLRRNHRLEAALPALRAAADAQRASAARFSLAAPSEETAVESLKERLIHLAADEGFAVGGVEDLQANAAQGTVRIRADMTLTLSQLTDTMKRLESEGAYVVVDYISISADRAFAAGRLSPMDVRLELTAAWRPAGPRSS
jgi:Tfp pilus assembly protein PilO